MYGIVICLIFLLGYLVCYKTLDYKKMKENEAEVKEITETQTTLEESVYKEITEDNGVTQKSYTEDGYKLFYGTWEFTEVVSEHIRLGGDEGYESLLGEKVTYLPDYYTCKGYGEEIEEIENPQYQIYVLPMQKGYNQFWVEQTGIEELLPEAQLFVYVIIGDTPLSKGGQGYCGTQFIIKDESTMFAYDYNCIYKLERISYMEGHEEGEYIEYQESWS